MALNCLLLGSPTIGWNSGIVVLDVVRGERVLDELMLNTMHVRTFVEECKRKVAETTKRKFKIWVSLKYSYKNSSGDHQAKRGHEEKT
jgi:hypothetical protein